MKLVEKISLIIFSYIVLILAIFMCLFIFNWLDVDLIQQCMNQLTGNETASAITLGVSVVLILLAIRCIFFDTTGKEIAKQREGILLENGDGKLLISKDTIENLVASVAKGFDGAENVNCKVYVDKENNLSIYVTLFVHPDAVIKDLSSNLQNRIKEAIKKSSDLDVKEVNIKVRNITADTASVKE